MREVAGDRLVLSTFELSQQDPQKQAEKKQQRLLAKSAKSRLAGQARGVA